MKKLFEKKLSLLFIATTLFSSLALAQSSEADKQLIEAVRQNNPSLVKKAAEAGANLSMIVAQQSPQGYTGSIVDYAVQIRVPQALRTLLELKAPANNVNVNGKAPLFIAADNDDTESFKLLLEFKADLTVKYRNRSLFDYTYTVESVHFLELLLKAGYILTENDVAEARESGKPHILNLIEQRWAVQKYEENRDTITEHQSLIRENAKLKMQNKALRDTLNAIRGVAKPGAVLPKN